MRLLTYLPGVPLADVKPHTADLLAQIGRFLAQMDRSLLDFSHPAMRRDLHRHPELSWQETRTAAKVCKVLDELGIEYRAGVAGTARRHVVDAPCQSRRQLERRPVG